MKQKRLCTEPGCTSPHYAKGKCRRCYLAAKGEKPERGRPPRAPVVVVDVETRRPWWDENATEAECRQIAVGQIKTLLSMDTDELDIATRTNLLRIAKDLGAGGDAEMREKFRQMMSQVQGA